MKYLMFDEVANHLMANVAVEFESNPNRIVYWLHIGEDGNPTPNLRDAVESFSVTLTPAAYGLTNAEFEAQENPEVIYSHESIGDPIFDNVVSSLTYQANRWISDNED